MEIPRNLENEEPKYIDLRSRMSEFDPPKQIRVEADLVAADLWQSMISQSQQDGAERGVIVSIKGNKLVRSKIFRGYKADKNNSATLLPPFFNAIRRPLLAPTKRIVLIHSHPITPDLDHLKTLIISGKDMDVFAISSYNALVAIDKGGAHLVTKRTEYVNRDIDGEKIEKEAYDYAQKKNISAGDVREYIAKALKPNGYFYFYSPNLTPSSTGHLILQSCSGRQDNIVKT